MAERKYDAGRSGIRAVKAITDGVRLKVAIVCEKNDCLNFRCGDVIENLSVPGTGILSGVICGIAHQRDASGDELHSFEFLAQHCRIEPVPALPPENLENRNAAPGIPPRQ